MSLESELKRIGDLLETYVKITISSCNVGIGKAEVVEPKEEPKTEKRSRKTKAKAKPVEGTLSEVEDVTEDMVRLKGKELTNMSTDSAGKDAAVGIIKAHGCSKIKDADNETRIKIYNDMKDAIENWDNTGL